MNLTQLIGRLVKDPELRYTNSNKAIASFTLAVDGFNDHTDFIRCKAWGKTAETLANNTHKGSRVGVYGRIETGSYEGKDGNRVYTTDVVLNGFDFLDPKQDRPDPEQPQNVDDGGYSGKEVKGQQIDIDDNDLPF